MSNTLKAFGEMRAKRQDQPLLLEVRRTLTSLHQYMKPVVTTRHPEKIAFELSSKRMQHQNSQDPISVLHQVAYQSPLPLKSWLDQIADSAWHLLMKEAGHYVDVAWREQVAPYYAEYLEKRYPFTAQSKEDVDLDHFTQFFGRSGHLHVFYQNYLDPFLDYEEKEWRFKKRDGEAIPLTQVALKQIQEALRVHEAFFPNGNDDMRVTFGIRPYAFGDKIKQVNLRVNGDEWQNTLSKQNTHWVEWPERHGRGSASYTYLLKDNKMQSGRYPGTWGLFRLVEKTYDAMLSKQEVLVELSTEGDSAKYVISTKDPINPLIYSKMGYMRLPSSLLA